MHSGFVLIRVQGGVTRLRAGAELQLQAAWHGELLQGQVDEALQLAFVLVDGRRHGACRVNLPADPEEVAVRTRFARSAAAPTLTECAGGIDSAEDKRLVVRRR